MITWLSNVGELDSGNPSKQAIWWEEVCEHQFAIERECKRLKERLECYEGETDEEGRPTVRVRNIILTVGAMKENGITVSVKTSALSTQKMEENFMRVIGNRISIMEMAC